MAPKNNFRHFFYFQLTDNRKMLIFIATQDMVDFHTELLSAGLALAQGYDSDDEDSPPQADIQFFKLHGNMSQSERTQVFKTFRKSHSGVLLCTVRILYPVPEQVFEDDVTQ